MKGRFKIMKYNNKLELIEAIKSNANLFIKEYYDIEETSMKKIDEETEKKMGKFGNIPGLF